MLSELDATLGLAVLSHCTTRSGACLGLCNPLVPIVEARDIGQKLCDVVDVRALGHLLLGGL
jgi:hypothetical protein